MATASATACERDWGARISLSDGVRKFAAATMRPERCTPPRAEARPRACAKRRLALAKHRSTGSSTVTDSDVPVAGCGTQAVRR